MKLTPDKKAIDYAVLLGEISLAISDRVKAHSSFDAVQQRDDARRLIDWDDAMAEVTSGLIDATNSKERRVALLRTAAEIIAWIQAIDREVDRAADKPQP